MAQDVPPEQLKSMTGIELRRLRRSMGMELSEFQEWRAKKLGEKIELKSAFSHPSGKPLWLKNTQKGAAFLICGGPSLKELDLTKLSQRGIWTLAINNAACMVRPSAMVCVDPPGKFHSAIWRDPAIQKFVPHGFSRYGLRDFVNNEFVKLMGDGKHLTPREMPNVVVYRRCPCFDPDTYLEKEDICWGVSKKWHRRTGRPRVLNSMLAAVKIVYELGFRVLYLVGCDFYMSAESPYAFSQGGDAQKAASNNGCYAKMNEMFHELRPRFDEKGFRVFNCNPDSGLTAFDYVDFNEAVRCTAIKSDMSTKGWYDGKLGKVGDN